MEKKIGSRESKADWHEALKRFFQTEIAQKAGSYLSERAVIALHMEEGDFVFQRLDGKNSLSPSHPEALADVHFWVPEAAMRYLFSLAELPGVGMGTLGVAIIEHIFQSDKNRKIRFRVDSGFVGLLSKGYFSVLKAGGPEVASYLKRTGFHGLSRIRDALKNIRG